MLNSETLMVTIADLGLAIKMDDERAKTEKCGTPSYVDPSVLRGSNYCMKSDIFSLGSIFFNMITSRLLYSGHSTKEMLRNNMNQDTGPIVDRYCGHMSTYCMDLLKQMLRPN